MALVLLPFSSMAQVSARPSAGSLLQDIDQERMQSPIKPPVQLKMGTESQSTTRSESEATSKSESESESETTPYSTDRPKTVKVWVKHFVIQSDVLLANIDLDHVTHPYVHKHLTFKQLQQLIREINQAYEKRGWLVSAYYPKQDVTEGVIQINVIQAQMGNVDVQGQFDRIAQDRIEKTIQAQIGNQTALSLFDLEHALSIANELPGVAVSGLLTSGQRSGQTDLVVDVKDEPVLSGRLQVDNQGNQSTGVNEASVQVNLNSPMGWGDQVTLYALSSEGLNYGSLTWSAPWGYRGRRFGISASTLGYRVIDAEFVSKRGWRSTGTANTVGVNVSQPIERTPDQWSTVTVNLSHQNFANQFGPITLSEYQSNVLSMTLNGQLKQSGQGLITYHVKPIIGHLQYSHANRGDVNRAKRLGLPGTFKKVRLGLTDFRYVTKRWSTFANLRGQLASKNLDASERFYLGGPMGVRAYPNSEGGGSQGAILSAELRYQLNPSARLGAFYDIGYVQILKGQINQRLQNEVTLQGFGLTASWVGPYQSSIQLSWARRIGSNPSAPKNGRDQDGSLSLNRFWLVASMGF